MNVDYNCKNFVELLPVPLLPDSVRTNENVSSNDFASLEFRSNPKMTTFLHFYSTSKNIKYHRTE